MANQQQPNETEHKATRSGRYPVKLDSRGGKVVYAQSMTQKQILETAERIIAKANKKLAQ